MIDMEEEGGTGEMAEVGDKIQKEMKRENGNSLPEAPASVTVRGYYKGYSLLATTRDEKTPFLPLLEKGMKAVDWMAEKGFKPSWVDNKPLTSQPQPVKKAVETFKCPKCGATASYKEGIKEETGKQWRGIFCSNEECKNVQWLGK